ncbi:MAG: S8 family serine peptidase [Luteibaculaceae bacterium]
MIKTRLRKFLAAALMVVATTFMVDAQKMGTPAYDKLIRKTNVSYLNQLSAQLEAEFNEKKREAWEKAEKEGWITREVTDDYIMELMELNELGGPVYYYTDNRAAAETIGTTRVWTNGEDGLTYDGENMIVGEWDGGAVRLTHREFSGRAIQRDGATSISNHATHVGGTMIGAGISPEAKGMAHKATLWAHDWNNDAGEMAARAGEGLLISNHSYGTIAGWRNNTDLNRWEWFGTPSISEVEDWQWGYYGSRSVTWDLISHNAPYYLIVKSAGNDRGRNFNGSHFVRNANNQWVQSSTQRLPDGGTNGHDCLSNMTNAKNILTIGAVNRIVGGWQGPNSVVMSSFSGWGPTDDGRIKPDIVGNGVGLFSAASSGDAAYATLSGTSMSAPNVSGSLILLQEAYEELNEEFMLASTLKALTIHTADEAGPNEGPDYVFGWGLMNTSRAIATILNDNGRNRIGEHTLVNNQTFRDSIEIDGSTPFRATIAWTDLPGSPAPVSLNPANLMLVNDLDIRLRNIETNEVYQPWILDPANPSAAATTGDNFRDNVEQILVANIPAGDYVVEITHKGNLAGGSQEFGLIYSGVSNNLPPVARVRTDNTSACVDEVFTLTDFSQNLPDSWTWSIFPETFEFVNDTDENSQNPQVIFLEEGLYSITLLASNSFGSNERTYDDLIEVSLGNEVEVNITFDNFGSDITWEIVNELGAVMASGGNYPDGENGSTANYTFCLPDGCYTININDSFGDGLCCAQGNGSFSISVNGNIFVTAAEFESLFTEEFCVARVFLDEFVPICGSNETFELEGGFPEGGIFQVNGEPIAGNTINPSLLGAGIFAITYIFNDFSITQELEILEPVTPTVAINSTASSICPNTLVNILSSRQNAGSSPVFQWTINGNTTGANAPVLVTNGISSSTDEVVLTMTSSLSCVTTATAVSAPLSFVVNPRIPLTGEISLPEGVFCSGTEVLLQATVTSEIPNTNVSWNVNGTGAGSGLQNDFTLQNLSLEPQVQNVVATFNTTYPCPQGPASITVSGSIVVNPQPEIIELVYNEDTAILSVDAVGTSFTWFRNGVEVATTTLGSFVPTQTGDYTVLVENTFGCSSLSDIVFIETITTNIAELEKGKFNVFPNPNSGLFNVTIPSSASIENLELIDGSGRSIENLERKLSESGIITLDYTHLAQGVYYLRIISNGEQTTQKIVIQ